jgi:hypothetical protein
MTSTATNPTWLARSRSFDGSFERSAVVVLSQHPVGDVAGRVGRRYADIDRRLQQHLYDLVPGEPVGERSPQVAAPAQYGPRIKALAVYLAVRWHLPYERCGELLADCLGAQVATSTLIGWNAVAAQAVAPYTEVVRQQLIACDVVGFDETGTRVAGRTCWVHTACTKAQTLKTLHSYLAGLHLRASMSWIKDLTRTTR